MKHYFVLCSLILSIAGCTASSVNQISVYKSLGGIQCQGQGKSLLVIRQELLNANIGVFGNGIQGDDGVARITVCGAPTGEIGIFMINKQDLKKAKILGFMQYIKS